MHRRIKPKTHKLRYRAFWTLLDLDELPSLDKKLRLFSLERFNLFGFYTADHGDGSKVPLRTQAEKHLATAGIDLEGGKIELLCMPRMLGFVFNPISVYYCYRRDGALAALIYEVHNTFGERHSYVLAVDEATAARNGPYRPGNSTAPSRRTHPGAYSNCTRHRQAAPGAQKLHAPLRFQAREP